MKRHSYKSEETCHERDFFRIVQHGSYAILRLLVSFCMQDFLVRLYSLVKFQQRLGVKNGNTAGTVQVLFQEFSWMLSEIKSLQTKSDYYVHRTWF